MLYTNCQEAPANLPARAIELEISVGKLVERGSIAEAVPLQREALKLAPRDPRLIANLASLLRMTGDLAEAGVRAMEALKLQPINELAAQLVTDLCSPRDLAQVIPELEQAIQASRLPPEALASLHYACGRARHRMGDYDRSFWHASLGAALRRSRLDYDVDNDIAVIDHIIASHCPPTLPSASYQPKASIIFVSGLPRSGTTLMEQLILRGSSASSIGERSNLQDAIGLEMRAKRLGAANRAEAAGKSVEIDARKMFEHYIKSINSLEIKERLIVDKTPMNALFSGLIAAGHGGARNVQMQRSPQDSLIGIFRTDFHGLYPFSLNLKDLAKYISAFNRLTRHWLETLPESLFRVVSYEHLASFPAEVLPTIFEFLGLTWDDTVLHSNARQTIAVSASAAQIRSEVHSSYIAAWRHYEQQVAEVADLLEL